MSFSWKTLRHRSLALSALFAVAGFSHSSLSQSNLSRLNFSQSNLSQSNSSSITDNQRFLTTPDLADQVVAHDTVSTLNIGSTLGSISSALSSLSPFSLQPAVAATSDISALWQSKEIRGIYMSRYRITNNTPEETIRNRVRYYKQQGINTIIHGVWGNGCPMYDSDVMMETFGTSRCDNEFQADWLAWLIDEAHNQDMQVHAYFEKGIKLDAQSPIFEIAEANGWFVPGIDRTYPSVDHYVLDVNNPQVSQFFEQILAEFVRKYPTVDAVQWDDYLGYHAGLADSVDRTSHLTSFVQRMRTGMKHANPNVSFDICHHNPYWGARYFAADWVNWGADRTFIQAYNDANFYDELSYIESSAGVAISDNQLHRLEDIINNPNIKSVLIFPTTGDPVTAARRVNEVIFGR